MYYVTILYRNKKHKIKTERGVDVTRKCDGQTDGQTDRRTDGQTEAITISPTFVESAGIINLKKPSQGISATAFSIIWTRHGLKSEHRVFTVD